VYWKWELSASFGGFGGWTLNEKLAQVMRKICQMNKNGSRCAEVKVLTIECKKSWLLCFGGKNSPLRVFVLSF